MIIIKYSDNTNFLFEGSFLQHLQAIEIAKEKILEKYNTGILKFSLKPYMIELIIT